MVLFSATQMAPQEGDAIPTAQNSWNNIDRPPGKNT